MDMKDREERERDDARFNYWLQNKCSNKSIYFIHFKNMHYELCHMGFSYMIAEFICVLGSLLQTDSTPALGLLSNSYLLSN